MKIRKLQLRYVGGFGVESIEFQPCHAKDRAEIHIFTGQNGSGKSTLLMALASSFEYFGRPYKPTIQESSHPLHNNFHKRFRENSYVQVTSKQVVSDGVMEKITVIHKDAHSLFPVGMQHSFDFYHQAIASEENIYESNVFSYFVFACSGYRQIETETVQANYLPKKFNPLFQSLEFIKDYRKEGEITINQLIANNISNRALSKEEGSLEEAKRYEAVISAIETFIKDVTEYEIKFVLKRSPNELKLRMHGEELDFDVLPDGLRSLISWIADLLGRVDLLKWQDDLPINEKNLILFLDEIEVHLHPAWQRKVLPVVQKLFKNAQIFVSTHSPFVVNSVDDAWVYKLKVENGKAKVESVERSEDGNSYSYVLEEIFDIKEEFGVGVEKELDEFYQFRNSVLSNGSSEKDLKKMIKIAKNIAKQSEELNTIIQIEIRQINRKKGLHLKI